MWLSTQQAFASSISILVVAVAVAAIIFLSIFLSINTKQLAFGDGLTQEQLSASLGNRKADLLIKMTPSVVTTETLQTGQKPIVEFRLFDSNTNESFTHVTYYIILEKDGERLLTDIFHDHNGDLKIQMNPTNTSKTAIAVVEGYRIKSKPHIVMVSTPFKPIGFFYDIDKDLTSEVKNYILSKTVKTKNIVYH